MPKVNLKGCRDTLIEVAGDALSKAEADSFVEALDRRIHNIDQDNLGNLDERVRSVGNELVSDLTKVAILNKRNALMAMSADQKLTKSVSTYETPTRGYLAFLDNSQRYAQAAGRGIDAIINGYKTMYLGALKARLVAAKVMDEFRKDLLVPEIFKEFYGENSGSEKAAQIKDIMVSLKQDAVERQNLYGSNINFLPEHVKRQTYSPNLVKKNFGPDRFQKFINFDKHLTPEEYAATYDNWKSFITPLLDSERTFKDADKEDFLHTAFDNIMQGKRTALASSVADGAELSTNFFKAGSLAKKASQPRLFHFKDGDSAFAAHKMFSDEPLSKGFIIELEHAASNVGLMQQLGPSPKETLTQNIDAKIHEYSRSGQEENMRDLQEGRHKIMSALSYIDRSINVPENPTMQTATASIISLLSQAKLGKLFFFALPDKALIQSTLTRNGMTGMDALATALTMKKPSNPDERLRLMMMGGELKSFISSVNTRFSTGSESGVPSAILKSQKNFFNLTGINWIDDVGTDAIVGALSRHLGAMADRPFDKLIPEMQRMFNMYDIKPNEWEAMRKTVYSIDGNGNPKDGMHGTDMWVTPDRFKDIPPSDIVGLLGDNDLKDTPQNRARMYDQLQNKVQTWLTAQRDEGVLMPGSREHRLATFGTQSGTAIGSMARIIMMFKTFPITVYTKIMEREMFGNGQRTFMDWIKNEASTNFHTTQLIALSTIAGYLSLQADELLQGKNPRRFTDSQGDMDTAATLKVLRDSFLRGNAASLLGDLMLREYDTGYNNILSQLGGPAVNEAIRTSALISQTAHGDIANRGKDSVEWLHRNLPWVNLFYAKPALDHLIWFNIQEMLNPGSLRQAERNHNKNYNQDYWLPPSDVHDALTK